MKIYGKNWFYEAIKSKSKLNEIYLADYALKKDHQIESLLQNNGYKYKIISRPEMDKKFGVSNQGYGAFREEYKYSSLNDMFNENPSRVLLLDSVVDPQNLGSMIRSCDALGVKTIIIPKNRSVSVTSTVGHVSMGAIEYVSIVQVNNLTTAIKEMKDHGYWIVGTDASFSTKFSDIDKDLNLGVVIGSEGFGMSRLIKQNCDYLVSIPMKGHVNSFNAAVSAAIVLAQLDK